MLILPLYEEKRAVVASWSPAPAPSPDRLQGRLAATLPKLRNRGIGFAIAEQFTVSFQEPLTSHQRARICISSIARQKSEIRSTKSETQSRSVQNEEGCSREWRRHDQEGSDRNMQDKKMRAADFSVPHVFVSNPQRNLQKETGVTEEDSSAPQSRISRLLCVLRSLLFIRLSCGYPQPSSQKLLQFEQSGSRNARLTRVKVMNW
jgi:hypothetical protein